MSLVIFHNEKGKSSFGSFEPFNCLRLVMQLRSTKKFSKVLKMNKRSHNTFNSRVWEARKTAALFGIVLLLVLYFLMTGSSAIIGDRHIAALPYFSSSAFSSPPWPMLQHDQAHTGTSAYVGPSSNTTNWIFGPIGGITSSPTVGSDGTVYITSSDGYMYALNPDGSLKWKYDFGEIPYSPVMDSNGTIYVPTTGHIFFLSSATGTPERAPLVIKSLGAILTPAQNGLIYANFGNGSMVALTSSGNVVWSLKADCAGSALAIGSSGYIFCVVQKNGSHLIAVTPNGEIAWTSGSAPGNQTVNPDPVVDSSGNIYFDGTDGNLYAVNSLGVKLWNSGQIGVGNVTSAPIIAPNGDIVVGGTGGVYSLEYSSSTQTLQEVWQAPASTVTWIAADSPGNVYAEENSNSMPELAAFSSSGSPLWSYTGFGQNEQIMAPLAMGGNGSIYVGSFCTTCSAPLGNVYAVGRQASEYQVDFSESGLALGTTWSIDFNQTVYYTTANNSIIFSAPEGTYPWSTLPITNTTQSTRYSSTPTNGSLIVSSTGSNVVALNYSEQYEVTWNVNPSAAGSTNASSGWYSLGTLISVGAVSNPGYKFESWTTSSPSLIVGSSGSDLLATVLVNGSGTITANFLIGLTLNAGSGGAVSYSGPAISGEVNARSSITLYLLQGTVVILTPVPSENYQESAWVGLPAGTQVLPASPVDLSITSPVNVTAEFAPIVNQTSTSTSSSTSSTSQSSSATTTSVSRGQTSATTAGPTRNAISWSELGIIVVIILAGGVLLAFLRRR
jgi:outer membrane protein assembly factor BamB